jgi:hypothetical protein
MRAVQLPSKQVTRSCLPYKLLACTNVDLLSVQWHVMRSMHHPVTAWRGCMCCSTVSPSHHAADLPIAPTCAGASTKPARTPSGKPVSKALQDWRGVTVPFTEHSKQQRSSKLLATTLTYSLQCDAALVAMAAQAEPLAARQVLMLAAVQHVEKTYSKRINASKTVIRVRDPARQQHALYCKL